jgi:hypothetical protein
MAIFCGTQLGFEKKQQSKTPSWYLRRYLAVKLYLKNCHKHE